MRNYLFVILCIVILVSCEKEKDANASNTEISMGTICGFTGGDYMSVTPMNVVYKKETHPGGKVSKEVQTPDNYWNELLSTLDYNKFKSINLNTCNSCVDGCDTWIKIKTDTAVHQITYGIDDTVKLKEIQLFIAKLESLRSQFNQ